MIKLLIFTVAVSLSSAAFAENVKPSERADAMEDCVGKGAKKADCKAGGLTSKEIMAVIRANLNQIRHCYEELLERQAKAQGKVLTTFVIDRKGKVETASVGEGTTMHDEKFRGCVLDRLRAWKFPKPRGGEPVTVNYPFVFNPL